jgi:hypothetical protein
MGEEEEEDEGGWENLTEYPGKRKWRRRREECFTYFMVNHALSKNYVCFLCIDNEGKCKMA